MLLATRMPNRLPTKRTNRMLIPMSSDIAFPGTLKRFSRPSSLIVKPSFEMPYRARLPSAVAVFIERTKLAQMTAAEELVAPLPTGELGAAREVDAATGLGPTAPVGA